MRISYKKLWVMLIQRDISKVTLRRDIGLSAGTMSKLIGATDAELKALYNKEITVSEIAKKIGSDLTDYTRASVI